MSWFEARFLAMTASDIFGHRTASAILNAVSLIYAGRLKLLAVATVERLRRLGIHLGLRRITDDPGPVGQASRTIAAIGELTVIQLAIYYPVALLLGVSGEVMAIAIPELALGCTLLWMYHRSYEWLHGHLFRPLAVAIRVGMRRLHAVHERFARHGGRR